VAAGRRRGLTGAEHPEGKAAVAFTPDVLANASDIPVEVRGRSFNWWVATVLVEGRNRAEVLIEAGHDAPYKG